MIDILPGILEKEWEPIERKLKLVKPFAKAVHIDLIDGKFAPNTTLLDPTPFKQYADTFFLELHMMVEEPISYLDKWADAGFRRFIGHVEHMSDQGEFVAKGENLGEVGLAVDAKTPLDAITVPYYDLDAILVMTVNAGFSGQSFLPECLNKVRQIKQRDFTEIIQIDGGVTDIVIPDAKKAGVSRFVATSFLFKSDHPLKQYERLQEAWITE
jgi:ribulose-phosphate 3-epimerase